MEKQINYAIMVNIRKMLFILDSLQVSFLACSCSWGDFYSVEGKANMHEMFFIKLCTLLHSGITDDDLRETAYEVLLACAGATGYGPIILFGLHIYFSTRACQSGAYFVYVYYLLHPVLFLFFFLIY